MYDYHLGKIKFTNEKCKQMVKTNEAIQVKKTVLNVFYHYGIQD